MRASTCRIVAMVFVGVAAAGAAVPAHAEPYTKVFLNGAITPVFFNDGDSFRAQAGPYKGTQARLSGYNTLESFGPVHSWGTWTEKETYALAKLATLTARRGVWHCEGDGKRDGYGRLLLFCKDLAAHLIKNGLAHAYSVDDKPADADLLAIQQEAMKARRGMWAHGVPRFVMTSLHSKAEGGDKNGNTSNRLISTFDGHSEKWTHEDTYKECQKVCDEVPDLSDADLDQLHEAMKADAEAAGPASALPLDTWRLTVRALFEAQVRGAVPLSDLAVYGLALPAGVSDADANVLAASLARILADKKIQPSGNKVDTCQVYVDFTRRFGGERAACLH